MRWIWRVLLTLFCFTAIGVFVVYLVNRHVRAYAEPRLQTSLAEIPATEDPPRIAIVFGAGVRDGGQLSGVLYDRVLTAAELYKTGRVRKILMSGDNPTHQYDEPTAMKNAAMELGVAESDIVLDFAGRRTYDTCYRAREIFEVRKAILVTQEFHQARALYLCNNLGVDSIGLTANRRSYGGEKTWTIREFFSVAAAWFEMNFFSFDPIGGKKEPIGQ